MWQAAGTRGAAFRDHFGIVLEVQQLFTHVGGRQGPRGFLANFDLIPAETLRAFHIHRKHRIPSLADPIPWREVFNRIRRLHQAILINLEIHHANGIQAAVAFCQLLLQGSQAAAA